MWRKFGTHLKIEVWYLPEYKHCETQSCELLSNTSITSNIIS